MNRLPHIHNQSGQISILLVISLMTMVLTVGLVFNTGQQLHWKTNVQNAVDSAVVSHGSNVARSMNVMSANNVAITQVFTLNVLMASLVPELTAASLEAADGIVTYTRGAASYCPNWFTAILCAANLAALGRTVQIALALEDIWDQIGGLDASKVKDARRMVQALESMNTQLYTNFNGQSAKMSERLAYMNGLDEAPVYIGGGAFYANKESDLSGPDYNGTWLPVEKTVTLQSGIAPVISGIDDAIQNFQLCVTGYKATPFQVPKAFWNMQEHGYDFGEGPFEIGKDRFNRAIERQVRRLEWLPESIPGFSLRDVDDSTDFEDIVEIAYPLACSLQRMVRATPVYPVPSTSITMYKVSKPVLLPTQRVNADWTIFGVARKKQVAGFAGQDLFVNPIKGHYAYAQVEVFNPIWYDLYTQDWTIKLQPANNVQSLIKDFVDAIAAQFPEIEPALREGEPKFNSH